MSYGANSWPKPESTTGRHPRTAQRSPNRRAYPPRGGGVKGQIENAKATHEKGKPKGEPKGKGSYDVRFSQQWRALSGPGEQGGGPQRTFGAERVVGEAFMIASLQLSGYFLIAEAT